MDFLVHHLLRTSALRYPEKEALVHKDQRLTYREVAQRVNGLAHGLRRAGVQLGDRVGIYLAPSLPQVISIFGVAQAGGAFVPINEVLFPNQVRHVVNDCSMKGLIIDETKLANLSALLPEMPSLEFLVLVTNEAVVNIPLPSYRFDELCGHSASGPLGDPPCDPLRDVAIGHDLAAILYTSGSTGRPKGIMLSHANILAGASIVSTYLKITGSDRILGILPLTFDAGLNQLTTAFQHGGAYVMMSFVFAREIVRTLLKEKITGLAGVPTLWSLLAQPNSGMADRQLPHLRYITNTGGAMPQSVLTVLRKVLPTTEIYLMYGLTEAFRSTYLPPEELDRRPTSIGKAIPNTEIMVVNEAGKLCKPGEPGELVHRGPTVSLGYWGHPELNERVFRPNPFLPPEQSVFERVCYSGDMVKTDEDGFIYFIGRRDAMIKTTGYRVSPTEVEEILFQSGQIQGAAVIGIPDEVLGQHIKAFVVPKNGEPLDSEGLLAFCTDRMPRYMVPKTIELIDALPKTSSGKVDYPALRRREGL
ncbi:MAG: acyl-CoA ligase (AMP-forming), exosortase A system-associated [Caldilineaceae bacterium]|nr:acyl-CoA ligase (AMP-forming), exosortase A system-associated [Caldilineaceae bacterium]